MPNFTQDFLEIQEIREGMLIMRDKSARGVLLVSSLNFALKSEDEQNAVIYQFQNFLNSLDFSVQVVIQSRKLNLAGYLDGLKQMEEQEQNELLKVQISEYQKFIRELIGGGSIMSKNFFVVVPLTLFETQGMMPGFFKAVSSSGLNEEQIQRYKNQLWQRMEFVALGLRRCGLPCAPLSTAELVELFWSLHHPEEAEVGYYPEIPSEFA